MATTLWNGSLCSSGRMASFLRTSEYSQELSCFLVRKISKLSSWYIKVPVLPQENQPTAAFFSISAIHPTMHLSIVSMAALASAPLAFAQLPNTPVAPTVPTTTPRPTAPTLPAAPVLPTNLPTTLPGLFAYPIKQVLPVPGWNTTTESFDTLATLYSNSSQQLYAQVVALGRSCTRPSFESELTIYL